MDSSVREPWEEDEEEEVASATTQARAARATRARALLPDAPTLDTLAGMCVVGGEILPYPM